MKKAYVCLCVAVLGLSSLLFAAEYPVKDITFVVPFDAGGTADIPARIVARYMSKYSERQVVVVNMPGAGGAIGAREVMKAKPDGYTVMHVAAGIPMQYALGNITYTYKDFEPVAIWLDSYLALVVQSSSPYKTLGDLVAAAKEQPGKIRIGAVPGTIPLFAELKIMDYEQADFNIVDLALTSKAPELLSGRISAYVDGLGAVKQFVDSGDFRCLGVFSGKRLAAYPDIPTFGEMGYENIEFLNQFFGMWAPKGTPPEAIAYLIDLLEKAAADPECKAELAKLSVDPTAVSGDDYVKTMERVYAAFGQFAKKLVK